MRMELGGPLGYQSSTLNNSLNLVQKNMLAYLSEKRTVFKKSSLTKTVSFEEQMMYKDPIHLCGIY